MLLRLCIPLLRAKAGTAKNLSHSAPAVEAGLDGAAVTWQNMPRGLISEVERTLPGATGKL